MTVCLEELQNPCLGCVRSRHRQEEENLAAGLTSPYEIRPDIAVAIDVTFATGPGVSDYRGRGLGKGVALAGDPTPTRPSTTALKSWPNSSIFPTRSKCTPRYSGTDAMGMQVVAEGIPTMVLSIPLRYMHTPVEIISLKDVQRAGQLLAQYIGS